MSVPRWTVDDPTTGEELFSVAVLANGQIEVSLAGESSEISVNVAESVRMFLATAIGFAHWQTAAAVHHSGQPVSGSPEL